MPEASYVQTSFLGGEISQAAQGRLDDPRYKISLNVCLNCIPVEPGMLVRRPGSRFIAHTRGGAAGRGISFSFVQQFPSYNLQFTDNFLRFTAGPQLVTLNSQTITALSTHNPAEITTATAHGWPSGSTVIFSNLGINNPLLQNRQFLWTSTGTLSGTIADALTGAAIDGSTLGTFVSGTIARVLEYGTPYTSAQWQTLRSVQAENRTLLLTSAVKPQVLQVLTPPSATAEATFSFGAADFIDGPYLDPIVGSLCSPSATNGIITVTFFYQTWDSTRAYNIGDYVTFSGQSYQSLTALNQGNTPNTSPGNWQSVSGGAAVNGGRGFVASDIGRLVRLYSQPPLWNPLSSYQKGNIVSYTDGNGGFISWTCLATTAAGDTPGFTTSWAVNAAGAAWTWGQITTVQAIGLIPPEHAFGTLSGEGGLAAAFDGNNSKSFGASAGFSDTLEAHIGWSPILWQQQSIVYYQGLFYQNRSGIYNNWAGNEAVNTTVFYAPSNSYYVRVAVTNSNPPPGNSDWQPTTPSDLNNTNPPPGNPAWVFWGTPSSPTYDLDIGQSYAVGKRIQYGNFYPTNDIGVFNGPDHIVTVNLRAKVGTPSSPSDGVLLGSIPFTNTVQPLTIRSGDTSTLYTSVWFELVGPYTQPLPDDGSHIFTVKIGCAQAQFYSQDLTAGSVIALQIRGNPLLYAQTISTWRLGVYSDTTGWPTNGTYREGRLWLGGVVGNRFDATVSNGFLGVSPGPSSYTTGGTLDFTPTSPDGTVSANNGISYTVAAEDTNPILWMKDDDQGVLFGTKSGEFLIYPPSAGAMAPANIAVARKTRNGCAFIEPRRTEHTLVVVHKAQRKIIEMFADVFSGKFTAPDLAERARHLTVPLLAEIAYQQEKAPIIWARCNNGSLIGTTYKRDTLMTSQGPTVNGWHRHALGTGRTVESLSSGPSANGNLDTVALVTNDASGVRHIEMITDILDEGFALSDCWFLDDAIVPTSMLYQPAPTGGPYGSLVVNGLWPHNGKTVQAFIAGIDCGAQLDASGNITYSDFVVANGSITIPFGDAVSGGAGCGLFAPGLLGVNPGGGPAQVSAPAVVGFTYNSDAQLVRPVEQKDTGARMGPGWGKLGRLHRAVFQVFGLVKYALGFGTDFVTLDPLNQVDGATLDQQAMFSGIARVEPNSPQNFDNQLAWRVSRPLPMFITAVGAMMDKEDV